MLVEVANAAGFVQQKTDPSPRRLRRPRAGATETATAGAATAGAAIVEIATVKTATAITANDWMQ